MSHDLRSHFLMRLVLTAVDGLPGGALRLRAAATTADAAE